MTFNPDANGVLGLQWPVTVESAYALDSPAKAIGAALEAAAATESIAKQSVYAAAVVGTARYAMEVRPLSATESPDVTTSTYDPNEDVTVTSLKLASGAAAAAGTAYPTIDDGASLNLADYLSSEVSNSVWKGRLNVGSGGLAARQILALTLFFDCQRIYSLSYGSASASLKGILNIAGTDYFSESVLVREFFQQLSVTWEYNPATGLPWTIADLEAFDTTDEVGFTTGGDATTPTRVFRVRATVDHVPEQRLAVGALDIAATGWKEFTLATPTGGASWSKVLGTEYVTTVRRLYGTGSASFRYLDSLADAPNGHHGYSVQVSGADGRLLEFGAELTRAFSLILTTTAPATSTDSQPYALRTLAPIYTGHTAEQEFTPPAASYGVVKVTVAGQTGTPTDDLLVKIRLRAGGAQVGSTMTISPDELTGTPTVPRELTVRTAATALTAAQHYLELSSAAANGSGWAVVELDTTGTGSSATFGSTTTAATVGGVEDTDTDLAVVIAQIPATPTGFDVVAIEGADGHWYARATWSATALGADFDHYELYRDDDGTSRQIAAPTIEADEEFDDYEARRGIAASYLLRVVHSNGVESEYAGPIVATSLSSGRLAFVTNEDPTLNLLFLDQTPHGIDPLDRTKLVELYGRDGAMAFRPLEDRYESFVRKLYVGKGLDSVDPEIVGYGALEPLRALCRAQLSYVCVLDEDGYRWLASVTLIDATAANKASPYVGTVQIRTLTKTPSTPDAVAV